MEIDQHFQSPILKEFLPDLASKIDPLCNKYIEEVKKPSEVVYHSNPLYKDPEFKELVDYIKNKSLAFLDFQGFKLSNHNLIFTEMWVQEFSEKGFGHHDIHVHWNNHISGFFFLRSSLESSYPVFQDPRAGALMSKLPLKDPDDVSYGSDTIFYSVQPGAFLLFNSYMPHYFPVDKFNKPFRFIHFNLQAIPKDIS